MPVAGRHPAYTTRIAMNKHKPWLAPLLSVLILLLGLAAWHIASRQTAAAVVVDPEYAALVGGAAATGGESAFPGPGEVGAKLWEHIKDPIIVAGVSCRVFANQLVELGKRLPQDVGEN